MNEFNYNSLRGPQLRIVNAVVKVVFFDQNSLDIFLADHGFEDLSRDVRRGSFNEFVFNLTRKLHVHGRLEEFIAATKQEYPRNPELQNLETRILEATRTILPPEPPRPPRPKNLKLFVTNLLFAAALVAAVLFQLIARVDFWAIIVAQIIVNFIGIRIWKWRNQATTKQQL